MLFFTIIIIFHVRLAQSSMNMERFNEIEMINNYNMIYNRFLSTSLYLFNCEENDEDLSDIVKEAENQYWTIHPKVVDLHNIAEMQGWRSARFVILVCSLDNMENLNITGARLFMRANIYKEDTVDLSRNKVFLIQDEGITEILFYKSSIDVKSFRKVLALEQKQKPRDLLGVTLRIGYLEAATYLHYDGKRFSGSIGDIFEIMKTSLNFTYEAVRSIDGYYGSKVDGGVRVGRKRSSYNGLVGMLERREIDIALTDISLRYDRQKVADWGGTMLVQELLLMVSRLGTSYQFDAYFNPLKQEIWLCVMVSSFGLAGYLCAIELYFYRTKQKDGASVYLIGDPDFWLELLGFSMRTMSAKDNFIPMSNSDRRNRKSWRIVIFSFLILGFFVVETYNAELTSYLTSQEVTVPIRRVEDILENNMKLSVPKGTAVVTLLQYGKEGSTFRRLWDEKVDGHEFGLIDYNIVDEFLLNVLKENYVVVGFGNDAKDFIGRNPCAVQRVPEDLTLPMQIGIYLQKSSQYTRIFQSELRILMESGVVDTVIKTNERSRQVGTCTTNADLSLGIKNTVFLFVCISCGIGLSALIFLFEVVLGKLRSVKDKLRMSPD